MRPRPLRTSAWLTIAFPLTIPFPIEDALRINPALWHDMENAPTAIMWSRLRTFLCTVKRIARIPDNHVSSGHPNELQPVPLRCAGRRSWLRNRILKPHLAYISFGDSWKATCCTGTRYMRSRAMILSSEPIVSSFFCIWFLGDRRYA